MENRPYWKECSWKIWDRKRQPLPEKPEVMWNISICTACMGRTDDLKRTLVQNILDNEDYNHLEFVVLNYNSRDDMHDFMTSATFRPYITSGRVKYLRTRQPRFFLMSHSRNVAFKNAGGHIVTNVDADNFTGKGFASYLNRLANVCPRRAMFARGKRRIHGRIGMFKDEFQELGGYDEDLKGYGYEDHSLMLRTMYSGYTLMWWADSDVDFNHRIITPRENVGTYLENPNWRETERVNKEITLGKIGRCALIANKDRSWGYVEDLEVFS